MFSSEIVGGVAQFVDVVSITLAGAICYAYLLDFNIFTIQYYGCCVVFVAFVTLLILRQIDLYEVDALMRPIARSDFILLALVTAFLFFLSIAFALKASEVYSRLWLLAFASLSFGLTLLNRLLYFLILRALSRDGLVSRNLAVLGAGEQGRLFLERLKAVHPYFVSLVGVFSESGDGHVDSAIGGVAVLGDAADLVRRAREGTIDDVVIAMPWNSDKTLIRTIEALKELPVNVYISSDLIGFHITFRPAIGHSQALPMFEIVQRPISGWSFFLKFMLDYVGAVALLILLSPLFLIVAVAIKLDSPGPVFFMQRRLGFNNQVFRIYKFRSMYDKPEDEGRIRQASRGDSRVTRVGRFLRRSSIDELPQLLNVLEGTMSLVGPRPHIIMQNEAYSQQIRGYFARHKVKPGITGWAQVNGYRGETPSLEAMQARVDHDIYYVENWSLIFDLRIILTTAFVGWFQKNAY